MPSAAPRIPACNFSAKGGFTLPRPTGNANGFTCPGPRPKRPARLSQPLTHDGANAGARLDAPMHCAMMMSHERSSALQCSACCPWATPPPRQMTANATCAGNRLNSSSGTIRPPTPSTSGVPRCALRSTALEIQEVQQTLLFQAESLPLRIYCAILWRVAHTDLLETQRSN